MNWFPLKKVKHSVWGPLCGGPLSLMSPVALGMSCELELSEL